MDDKEKYEQAKARMVEWVNRSELIVNPKEVSEYVFPELSESEDERVRKSLIKSYTNQHPANFPTVDGFTREQILAWLEKQGEQKPTDKVEQKFKIEQKPNLIGTDELILKNTILNLYDFYMRCKIIGSNSSTWKPSVAQMEALKCFLEHGCAAPDREASIAEKVLEKLYCDLKKLITDQNTGNKMD